MSTQAQKEAALQSFVSAISSKKNKQRIPHLAEMVEHLIREFGGPHKFAAKYRQVFDQAIANNMTRAKMLDGVLRLIESVSSQSTSDLDDVGALTEDDLRAAASQYIGKLTGAEEKAESSAVERDS
jgi:hypothetical protein